MVCDEIVEADIEIHQSRDENSPPYEAKTCALHGANQCFGVKCCISSVQRTAYSVKLIELTKHELL